MSESTSDPVVRLTELIASRIRRTRYAEFADDVAHDLYCEIRRHSSTQQFLKMSGATIQGGDIPGLLWRRARARARAMRSPLIQLDESLPISAVDESASRDCETMISKLDAKELCDRIPLFRQLLIAEREGLTREQFRKRINISERRYYSEIRRAQDIRGILRTEDPSGDADVQDNKD